jgi:hypothetical protein
MAALPSHIFAMKALAARTRDVDDLGLLADIIGVESADAALQICASFYPDEPVSRDPSPCSANFSADHSSLGHLLTPILPRTEPVAQTGSRHNQHRLSITPSGHRDLLRRQEIDSYRTRQLQGCPP